MHEVQRASLILGLSLLAAAAKLPANDPLGPARAALAEGRLEEARAALIDVDAPGLLGSVLEKSGDMAGACARYAQDRATARAPAAALRHARCLEAQNDNAKAYAAYLEVAAGPLGADPVVLAEVAAVVKKRDVIPLPDALRRALDMRVGLFDGERRERLADVLLLIADKGDTADAARALERLLVELGDTSAGKAAAALPAARERPPETLVAALKRATALADRHESDAVIAALSTFKIDSQTDLTSCEARLLLGKSYRKLRKYALAKRHLDAVGKLCGDETKKKGAYLAARVAFVSKNAAAAGLLEGFAAQWPNDPLTDDVLFWLGEHHERKNEHAKARAAWQTILDKHPGGDMIHDARFKLAFLLASDGDIDAARALLDEGARQAGARVDVQDRALYWRARLGYAPRLTSLEPTSDEKKKNAALQELVALAKSRPASYYGRLAHLLLVDARVPAPPPLERLRAGASTMSITTSNALESDQRFVLGKALVDAGYDEEALLVLQEIDVRTLAPEDRFAVVLLVSRAGSPGAGHAILRNAGLALLPASPAGDALLAWSLDWPRAYEFAIGPAADANNVPRALLFGLAREESAFDADVVSWAGAVGLCQLMPYTAKDEALALKLPAPDIDDLRDPVLNAKLGAAHIGRRLKGMRHPLLAIAAYNAGPGMVAQWVPPKGSAVPIDVVIERIPVDETRNYVKKVTGSWVTYSALDGTTEDVKFKLTL